MKSFHCLDSFEVERSRRLNGRIMVDPHADLLWTKSLSLIKSNIDRQLLLDAHQFAGSIKYDHSGLSPDIYFAHPVRVSALSMLYHNNLSVGIGILGLLHNIFELSDYSFDFISKQFGSKIADQISNLTVNRNLQWNEDYKATYYERITNGPIEIRLVKVFDKLDNLFILGVNPDEQVKLNYLKEIEKYVLPLAFSATPKVYDYMKRLVDDTYVNNFNL